MRLAKIKKGSLYKLPSGSLVRVIKVNHNIGKVFVYDYNSHQNEVFDIEIAPQIFIPIFRIGEVGKMLNKKPDTLRKYERQGLIPKVDRYYLSKNPASLRPVRLYTEKDIWNLVEFFMRRPGRGRPSRLNVGGVNRPLIKQAISSKFERNKNVI